MKWYILSDPQKNRSVGATILRILYGYEAVEGKDYFVDLVDDATCQLAKVIAPGAFMVDCFPACEQLHYIDALFFTEMRLSKTPTGVVPRCWLQE
jgi:hypothetical protein